MWKRERSHAPQTQEAHAAKKPDPHRFLCSGLDATILVDEAKNFDRLWNTITCRPSTRISSRPKGHRAKRGPRGSSNSRSSIGAKESGPSRMSALRCRRGGIAATCSIWCARNWSSAPRPRTLDGGFSSLQRLCDANVIMAIGDRSQFAVRTPSPLCHAPSRN